MDTATHNFTQKLSTHLKAGCPGFYIQSGEESRVDTYLQSLQTDQGLHIMEWNLAYGWTGFATKQPLANPDLSKSHPNLEQGLVKLLDEDLNGKLILLKNAKLALDNNSLAVARLQQLLNRIQRHHQGKAAVVLVSESLQLPSEIEAQISILPLPLPSGPEIDALITRQGIALDEALRPRLISTCSGLSELEICQVLALATQAHTTIDEQALRLILREKEQIIAKGGVLKMVKVEADIAGVGGLENLKDTLRSRARIIQNLERAKAFGIIPPKGILIAGMPGCGKSLTAKVAASLFGLPLLRLDIGSLLGKYVGESEHNMRRALHLAETVSPCILWIDELEKAFVGMGGNNASEVTARLLGYFLTWMQEKTGTVYVIATANDITALPPELLRKGRFDDIFYVGFPSSSERQAILGIHLSRAPQNPEALDLVQLAADCRDFTGADIQNAINEALECAFLAGEPTLTQQQLRTAIKNTVPLRATMGAKVRDYETKFESLKLKPASKHDGLSIADMLKFSDDPNKIKREQVASDLECPDDLLEKLAEDAERSVQTAVYQNPRCPERLLTKRINVAATSQAYSEDLLALACVHPNAPEDLILRLLDEGGLSHKVRNKLATAESALSIRKKLEARGGSRLKSTASDGSVASLLFRLIETKHSGFGQGQLRNLLGESDCPEPIIRYYIEHFKKLSSYDDLFHEYPGAARSYFEGAMIIYERACAHPNADEELLLGMLEDNQLMEKRLAENKYEVHKVFSAMADAPHTTPAVLALIANLPKLCFVKANNIAALGQVEVLEILVKSKGRVNYGDPVLRYKHNNTEGVIHAQFNAELKLNYVKSIKVAPGDWLREGQPIMRLDEEK